MLTAWRLVMKVHSLWLTRRDAMALIAGLFMLALIVSIWSAMRTRPAVTASPAMIFSGREPGLPYRAAGFLITNSGGRAIELFRVRVCAFADGDWSVLSEKEPEVSPVVQPGATNVNFLPLLEPGEARMITVEWPEEKPWRAQVTYLVEQKGVKAVMARARVIWTTRSFAAWNGSVWDIGGQITSEAIAR
jgi:hypothetical protein